MTKNIFKRVVIIGRFLEMVPTEIFRHTPTTITTTPTITTPLMPADVPMTTT